MSDKALVEATPAAIGAEEYSAILSGVSLVSIGLNSVQASVLNRQAIITKTKELAPEFEFSCEYQCVKPNDSSNFYTIVRQTCTVVIGEGESVYFALLFELQLDYSSEADMSAAFFEVFKNGPLIAHMMPYAREYVQSTMLRMGIPAYVLPLYHHRINGMPFGDTMPVADEDSVNP